MSFLHQYRVAALLVVGGVFTLAATARQASAQSAPGGWKMTWQDEFDGKTIKRSHWDFDIGNGFFAYDANQWISGWGNEELQYYTDAASNAFVQDGMLHIRAIKESLHGCGYTSARLKTRKRDGSPLFNQKYGRFEFRAKLPTGQGVWPALWMLPQDEAYGSWPSSGEIDVMETRGQEPKKVLGTLHYGARWPANVYSNREFTFSDDASIADFHVYSVEWEPGEIRWFVDDMHYGTQSFWWSSSKVNEDGGAKLEGESDLNPWPAPFDQPYYLIINLAIGGKFAGNPDATTPFPAEMIVDYVRVYEKTGGYGPTVPRGEGELPFHPSK